MATGTLTDTDAVVELKAELTDTVVSEWVTACETLSPGAWRTDWLLSAKTINSGCQLDCRSNRCFINTYMHVNNVTQYSLTSTVARKTDSVSFRHIDNWHVMCSSYAVTDARLLLLVLRSRGRAKAFSSYTIRGRIKSAKWLKLIF